MKLRRPARRALLVLHVATAVSWLGLSLGLFALALTAVTSSSPDAVEGSYRSMKMFADWLMIPVALTTLASGLVLALGTQWGLLLHHWVSVKFWLTLVTAGLTIFSLRPGINTAAAQAIAGGDIPEAGTMLVPPSVSLTAYLFMTAVSLLKPWGPTRRGRRTRARAGKKVDAGTVLPTA